MSQEKTLLLIDSHALLYRAYYAMPPTLTTRQGEPINAVFGFTSLLLDVLIKFEPTHCIAVMDSRGPTIRHQDYSFYKANRKQADDLFIQQIPRAEEMINTFNIPLLKLDGVEADDIIGTLAQGHKDEFDKIIIVTGDQDMFQLIHDNIGVYMAGRKFSESKLYNRQMVIEKLGVTPEQVPDYKGLCGDPSDNIPGVAGIGKKGASDLVSMFNSISGIYEHIDEVANRYKNKLIENQEMAFKSLDLATIKKDIPLSYDIKESVVDVSEVLVSKVEELEFTSLVKKSKQLLESYNANYVENDFIEELFEIDYWNNEELPKDLVLLANLANKTDPLQYELESFEIFVGKDVKTVSKDKISLFLKKIEGVKKIITFAPKELIHAIKNANYSLPQSLIIEDVGIYGMVYAQGKVSYDLDKIANYFIGLDSKRSKIESIEFLWQYFSDPANENIELKKVISLEHEISTSVGEMERNGVGLDVAKLATFQENLKDKKESIQADIYKSAGREFNINSPKQVSEVLFIDLKLPVISKTKTGNYSTNERALKKIAHEHRIVKQIIYYRELDKLLSTYIAALPSYVNPNTSRIHAVFDQMGTVSGRFSSRNPNLQNIPKGEIQSVNIRNAFTSRLGYSYIAADYSQQELRILAALSGEQIMVESFNNGDDIHVLTASEIFSVDAKNVTKDQRAVGKLVNFSVIYGVSAYGLAEQLEVPQSDAAMFINTYFNKYPKVKKFFNQQVENIKQIGYAETILGRRRNNELLFAKNKALQAAGRRELLNFIIQGSAADIMKIALKNVSEVVQKYKGFLVAQIHDEFLFEFSDDQDFKKIGKDINIAMTTVYDIGVDYQVELSKGKRWGSLKEFSI